MRTARHIPECAAPTQEVWGLPGLKNVPIADAVYASCALRGFFPPVEIELFNKKRFIR